MQPPNESQILAQVQQRIEEALPRDWSVALRRDAGGSRSRANALLTVTVPTGESMTYVVEAKPNASPQALSSALNALRLKDRDEAASSLVAAPYLGGRARELLADAGVSYVDTTGNLRLVSDRPALFVERSGATKDPWPDDQPLRALRGRGAARAVRALLDFRPPYGVRELASRANTSPATLSRVIDLLERDALLTRNDAGGVSDLDWRGAIRRWTQDYELRRSNAAATYLDPRGLPAFAERLSDSTERYAATGSLAAQRFAPIAPTRLAAVYVPDMIAAAKDLGLVEADAGSNVLLVEPYDSVIWDRTMNRDSLVTVAPTQLAADLLTAPGREPSEGVELLDWMEKNEHAWRT